jgi:uncharacterized membrane protein YphA (DoxX/SURF4 family)
MDTSDHSRYLLLFHRDSTLHHPSQSTSPNGLDVWISPTLHWISGTAEILGGLGLILPAVTRIQTRLVPLAAAGLSLVMILAIFFHLSRGDYQNLVTNIILAALTAFVAYGRWKLVPLTDRNAAAEA